MGTVRKDHVPRAIGWNDSGAAIIVTIESSESYFRQQARQPAGLDIYSRKF